MKYKAKAIASTENRTPEIKKSQSQSQNRELNSSARLTVAVPNIGSHLQAHRFLFTIREKQDCFSVSLQKIQKKKKVSE